MKKIILAGLLCISALYANAQITILDEDVQEKIVSKPRVFDSLSNITYQKDPIQYKQYIGYKLYCLPVSSKYSSFSPMRMQQFRHKASREFVLPHMPYEKTDVGKTFVYLATTKPNEQRSGQIPDADVSKLKGDALKQYREKEASYEKKFVSSTDIYKATISGDVSDLPRNDIQNYLKRNAFTPYDSVQNMYFTILNIEIGKHSAINNGNFSSLEDFDGPNDELAALRFTLKNDKTNEEIYWIIESRELKHSVLFLVPYFEKMQKTYKGQNVVATKKIEQLADISTGELVNILPKEIWRCYNVTFVNTKKQQLVEPYFLLEKDGVRVMINFQTFSEKGRGIFTEEDQLFLPTFILETEYNNIIAEKQRAEEERQRIAEERQREEELARQERNNQIMKKYGSKYGKLICEEQVCLNMTKEMCLEAWGDPLYINSTIVNGLVHEQWVYGWHHYLYFDNGKLTAIQN